LANVLVSVITPALDAGPFIARTLASVRSQSYESVEHIVVDGGSVDDTAAIVEREPSVRLIEAPGLLQAAAVNRGVAEAQGEIIVILNADDILYPEAIERLVAGLDDPDAVAVYADGVYIDEADQILSPYPTADFHPYLLIESCYICQPASAIRRAAFLGIGGMNPSLDVALDYDLWIRLSRHGRFRRIPGVLAGSRMHRANKTFTRRVEVYHEAISVLHAHYGYVPYTWTYAYACWRLYRKDGFFEQPPRTKLSVLLALGLGVWFNPRQPLRAVRDWYRHRAIGRR